MSHHHHHCDHHGSCSGHEEEDHHHHHCCCGDQSCEEHHHEEGGFTQELLELADDAWMEVLHDKIKENILAKSGKHLDELAAIVSDANEHRWKNKLDSHRSCDDFKQKIRDFFS